MFNTITVEVDLSDYEGEVFEYAEDNGYVKEGYTLDKSELE